jgi:hypothetical protein
MPFIGSLIGDYRLEAEAGGGSFGKVYRARSVKSGEVVAIKLVSLMKDDDVAAERLGALLQQQFEQKHGMVPKIFELGEDDHYFFIAMEFVEAPTLSTLIQRGPLGPAAAATHAVSICSFLDKTHAFATDIAGEQHKGIIHGDLKPEHVLVLGDGTIKVLDFGISKALATTKTRTRLAAATPAYAPPNRLDTTLGNEKDDLWALGVILYEMVASHRPYSRLEHPRNPNAVEDAVERNLPREPLPDSCPMALAAIIDKLLAFQEERRYESATAIRLDLEAFLRNAAPSAVTQFVTTPTVKRLEPLPATEPVSSVPTLPRVADRVPLDLPLGGAAAAIAAAPAASVMTADPPAIVRRFAWVAVLLLLTTLFTTEGVAWLGAERIRAQLPGLDVRSVAVKRQQYESLRRWSFFLVGPRLRLDGPLKERLVTLADAVIADFRQEAPTVAEAQWRQASDALAWASQLTPGDESLVPKELNCRGHLDRIAAQTLMRTNPAEAQRLYNRAIEEFERAARLDPQSADPYLGLSRVYIYGLKDVDRGAIAIHDAEVRGHQQGWRERAQLGDGYLRRADEARRTARRLSAESRRQALERARDDYASCVEYFTPILDKGRSKYNRDYCQRYLDVLTGALATELADGR